LGRGPQEVDSGEGVRVVVEDIALSVVLAVNLPFSWEIQCSGVGDVG